MPLKPSVSLWRIFNADDVTNDEPRLRPALSDEMQNLRCQINRARQASLSGK